MHSEITTLHGVHVSVCCWSHISICRNDMHATWLMLVYSGLGEGFNSLYIVESALVIFVDKFSLYTHTTNFWTCFLIHACALFSSPTPLAFVATLPRTPSYNVLTSQLPPPPSFLRNLEVAPVQSVRAMFHP